MTPERAEYLRAYHRANPDKQREYDRRRRARHGEALRATARARYASNPVPYSIRARVRRLRQYGLTPEAFDQMVASQGGRCAVCRQITTQLHVDHDHACCPSKTSCGACVRGLLCGPCNTALGLFSEDPDRLRAAAIYIEEPH